MSETIALDTTAEKRLDAIDDEEWGDLYVRLVRYARKKARNLQFVKGGGDLPLGQKPEGLAQEAIKRTLVGRRQWDPTKHPDLCGYLMDVIDSLVDALLQKADYRHQDSRPLDEHLNVPSKEDPSRSDECFEVLEEICVEACADAEEQEAENLKSVRQGLEDGMKSGEIADFFRIEVEDVYRLTRKLKRRVERAMADHPCNDHWQEIRS